jgi:hypothetical protein
MKVYRPNLTATLLTNGDVLVFGGTQLASSASEFYNPVTGTWTGPVSILCGPFQNRPHVDAARHRKGSGRWREGKVQYYKLLPSLLLVDQLLADHSYCFGKDE